MIAIRMMTRFMKFLYKGKVHLISDRDDYLAGEQACAEAELLQCIRGEWPWKNFSIEISSMVYGILMEVHK
jgi:hypothetical protein